MVHPVVTAAVNIAVRKSMEHMGRKLLKDSLTTSATGMVASEGSSAAAGTSVVSVVASEGSVSAGTSVATEVLAAELGMIDGLTAPPASVISAASVELGVSEVASEAASVASELMEAEEAIAACAEKCADGTVGVMLAGGWVSAALTLFGGHVNDA